jgi:hypothetical protein
MIKQAGIRFQFLLSPFTFWHPFAGISCPQIAEITGLRRTFRLIKVDCRTLPV